MENDAGVRELLVLVFGKKPTLPQEMVAHSSIPSDVLNKDFMKKFKDILLMQKFIMYDIWRIYFDRFYREMLSSHQDYLQRLMFTFLYMHEFNRNVFDNFISAFVLLVNISNEVLTKASIDFCDLNPDIIMVYYYNILKSFTELGGFYGFVEYVRGHRYFEWNWDENCLNLSDSETAFDNFRPDMDENIVKEYNSYLDFEEPSEGVLDTIRKAAVCMAKEVLSTTTVKLPTLPSVGELIGRLVAYRRKEIATKIGRNRKAVSTSTFETSRGDLRSTFVSKANYAEEQKNIARHENIIEAVIRHNRSNVSRQDNVKSQNQVKAERTLEHLQTSIKSLIEVLDDFNKE